MSARDADRISSAQQTLDSEHYYSTRSAFADTPFREVLYDISKLLNTQLDKETLATCVSMIESGVNPEALAVGSRVYYNFSSNIDAWPQAVVQELRRENTSLTGQAGANGQ